MGGPSYPSVLLCDDRYVLVGIDLKREKIVAQQSHISDPKARSIPSRSNLTSTTSSKNLRNSELTSIHVRPMAHVFGAGRMEFGHFILSWRRMAGLR